MKVYICDTCQTQGRREQDNYDMPPSGWFTLTEIGNYKAGTPTFCSTDCLAQHVQKRVLTEDAKTTQPEEITL